MKKTSGWLWGGILIVVGVLWLLRTTGALDVEIFFPGWWTLFIIIPSLVSLLTEKEKMSGLVGVLVGVALMLWRLGVISFDSLWKLGLPVALILLGVAVIVSGLKKTDVRKKIAEVSEEQETEGGENVAEGKEFCATFGGQDLNFAGKVFEGCRADALFGGIKIDLREAKLKKDAVLRTSCYFGGVDVLVPSDWNVEVAATSVFGGVEDKRKGVTAKDTKRPTLYIDATCVFGGVDVK